MTENQIAAVMMAVLIFIVLPLACVWALSYLDEDDKQ